MAQRNQSRGRRAKAQRGMTANDLWRRVPPPQTPEPIRPSATPRALLDSLGSPPLRGHSSTAEHYMAAVIERAAAVATALAASADLLAEDDDDAGASTAP